MGVPCEPLDEAAARERDEKAKAEDEARKQQEAQEKLSQEERETRLYALLDARENRLALAALLLIVMAFARAGHRLSAA